MKKYEQIKELMEVGKKKCIQKFSESETVYKLQSNEYINSRDEKERRVENENDELKCKTVYFNEAKIVEFCGKPNCTTYRNQTTTQFH